MKLTGPVINVIKSKGVSLSLSKAGSLQHTGFDRLTLTAF